MYDFIDLIYNYLIYDFKDFKCDVENCHWGKRHGAQPANKRMVHERSWSGNLITVDSPQKGSPCALISPCFADHSRWMALLARCYACV